MGHVRDPIIFQTIDSTPSRLDGLIFFLVQRSLVISAIGCTISFKDVPNFMTINFKDVNS